VFRAQEPNTEGTVGNISTWITSALQNEHFFSLAELNRAIREKLEQWLKHATDVLIRYLKWIQFWKEFYKPEPDEEWHELFTEALANERKINDYLDVLMFGTGEEIAEFFKMKRREVERIEERIDEYQREVLDGIRRYCERGDDYNRRC
jgi:DNA-directed RNA polymerase subunit N (RpoN/RPB10)